MSRRTIYICDFCKREGDQLSDFGKGFWKVTVKTTGLCSHFDGRSDINNEWHICATCQSGLHSFLEYELPKQLITESEAA
jgi:hypothetical protein